MTTQELNRDVKRLYSKIEKLRISNDEKFEKYFAYIETAAKKEFTRLYYADPTFKYHSAATIKIMILLNVRHRFIQFHHFGINIEL